MAQLPTLALVPEKAALVILYQKKSKRKEKFTKTSQKGHFVVGINYVSIFLVHFAFSGTIIADSVSLVRLLVKIVAIIRYHWSN
jgi:hypothetical protein